MSSEAEMPKNVSNPRVVGPLAIRFVKSTFEIGSGLVVGDLPSFVTHSMPRCHLPMHAVW